MKISASAKFDWVSLLPYATLGVISAAYDIGLLPSLAIGISAYVAELIGYDRGYHAGLGKRHE